MLIPNTYRPQLEQPFDQNVKNVDEIQIKPTQKLTFEQLIEKQLNEKEQNTVIPDDDRVIRKKPK